MSEDPGNGPAGSSAVLVRMEGIAKAFGPTRALVAGSFELRAGEVHILMGENGSGKSTLVKVLSGVHAPDEGTIEVGGVVVPSIRNPRVARDMGIATVFQEVLVAEARSILDNVCLGLTVAGRQPGKAQKREMAGTILEELFDRTVDLSTPVEELSLSDRQSCCIARALIRNPRVLILDEATSALDVATRDRLFRIVHRLTADGVGVIFITHRMDEISAIGGRVTVMRSGETVATLPEGQWETRELVRLMTGSERLSDHTRERGPTARVDARRVVLGVRGVRLRPDRAPIDLDIHAGELLGLAGLEGQGQEQLLEVLRGAPGISTGDVTRHTDDGVVPIRTVDDAAANGIAYVPRERGQAIFRWMSIHRNFGLPTITRDRRFGLLSIASTRRRLAEYKRQLNIVLGTPDDRITTLSGGNQQKVVIARWLASNPSVLLLNDPTRGIDIQAKRDLYELLDQMTREQVAIVMLSTELDEHVELMDRVLVFREHELFREFTHEELSRRSLVSAFFGGRAADEAQEQTV